MKTPFEPIVVVVILVFFTNSGKSTKVYVFVSVCVCLSKRKFIENNKLFATRHLCRKEVLTGCHLINTLTHKSTHTHARNIENTKVRTHKHTVSLTTLGS